MKGKFQREVKKFFKSSGSKGNRKQHVAWWIPKVPSIITMFLRCLILSIISIGFFAIATITILGEDVFWTFNLVDKLYSNIGTNPNDVWTVTVLYGWLFIWGVGMFWVVGWMDRWFD